MKTYQIPQVTGKIDWSKIPSACIDTYRWETGATPRAEAKLVLWENSAFYVRMTCWEKNPTAVYHDYFSPVWNDSCLEFFCAFSAQLPLYLNVEMNSQGAYLAEIGTGRSGRQDAGNGTAPFSVTPEVFEEYWQVTLRLPLEKIHALFGTDHQTFCEGYRFHGNFYKCGDQTPHPHFGMWNGVEVDKPDFHRPEWFGDFVIGETIV